MTSVFSDLEDRLPVLSAGAALAPPSSAELALCTFAQTQPAEAHPELRAVAQQLLAEPTAQPASSS